jgi:hypothetical protein
MAVIRPKLWRPGIVVPVGFVACISAAGAVSEFVADQPGQAVAALMCPVVIMLIIGFRTRSVRLEITDSVVLARQGHSRAHPDKQAPRADIRAIHYFPRIISFRGQDKQPIMMIAPNYTLRQMTQVAAMLGVCLHDHTRWYGTRRVDRGRLVYQPESGQVTKTPE